jgi:S1-C subfamily serine protease
MALALGMGIGAEHGIVGRLGVNVQVSQTETFSSLIETSAALNPGNSGGPKWTIDRTFELAFSLTG